MNVPVKKRLGELLVDAGIIDETQLKAALGHQRQWGVRLGQALVDLKLATEQEVVRTLARRFGFEVARLDQVEAYAHQQAVGLVPRDFAVKHNVFPLGADTSTLSIAMSDPSNLAVIDELRFRSGRRVKVSIGGDREIAAAVQAAYPSADGAVEAIALDIDDGMDPGEPVLASFGGGSSEDFDSFFGAEPAQPAEPDPFGAGPAEAPLAVPASQPAGPSRALSGAPIPTSMPAAFAAPAPAPAPRPAAPMAASPSARATAPTAPAMRAAPATPAPRAAPGPAPAPARAPAQPRPAPAAAQPRAAAPRPSMAELELELPSTDAVRDARVLRGPTAASATPMPAVLAPLEPEEELTPLSEDIEFTGSLPIAATAPSTPAPVADAPATPSEQAILAALRRQAEGGLVQPEVLKPTQLMAALAQLLLQKGLITERELLDALGTSGED